MNDPIKRYPVQHPLLRKYIRFFWEFRTRHLDLNHAIIPQRNINLRFNLGETPQYILRNGEEHLLEQVFFSGLQDHFNNTRLKLSGNADILGICFYPDAFYPFVGIPVSEFKNVWLGANEIGFKQVATICEKLKEAPDTVSRLALLEGELVSLLLSGKQMSDDFRQIFQALKRADSQEQIAEFCRRNNIGERRLERMFSKYVGISASTFGTLDRFHNSMNRLIAGGYSKLSDLAYDNGYFDQMHFIRDFRRFAGNTPKRFASQNSSILQIAKLR